MRVLLVYSNTYHYLDPPPLGPAMVARSAAEAGHDVQLLDLLSEAAPERSLDRALSEGPWDLIGVSLRNLDNQDMAAPRDFVPEHCALVARCSAVAPTVIGGSALMSAPEALFRRSGARYALCGQADRVFGGFVNELESGGGELRTPGAMWWQDDPAGGPRVLRRNPGLLNGYEACGSIPWAWIPEERYRSYELGYPVLTKSGCPYKCLFCDTPASFGDRFVPRPIEAVVEDLRRDAREGRTRYGTFFVDACFNEPLDWAVGLLEEVVRSRLRLSLSAIVEPTPSLDRDFVRLFRRAGGSMVTCLLGSVDEGMLERLRRPYGRPHIERAFDLFEEEGLAYMPQFLFGGPGETDETVRTSLRFLKGRKPLLVDFAVGLRINPEAGLAEVARKEGVIDRDTDLLAPRFYVAEGLDVEKTRARAKAARPRTPIGQWARYLAHAARVRLARPPAS